MAGELTKSGVRRIADAVATVGTAPGSEPYLEGKRKVSKELDTDETGEVPGTKRWHEAKRRQRAGEGDAGSEH